MKKQRVICITGMERSGTSAIARLVNVLGVYLGSEENLIMETAYNEKGCWESKGLLDISENILKKFDGSTHKPPVFESGWTDDPRLNDIEMRAREIIKSEFENQEMWGWKDTRCCLTLPFWQKIVPEMEYVICVRNPASVAKSVVGLGWTQYFEEACLLWLNYTANAVKYTQGSRRVFVFYDDIMQNGPLSEMRRIADFLGVTMTKEMENEAVEFLDNGLRHHDSSVMATIDSENVPLPVKAAYLTLLCFARGGAQAMPGFEGVEASKLINEMLKSANSEESLMNKIHELIEENAKKDNLYNSLVAAHQTEKDLLIKDKLKAIGEMENSLSWKITAPIRKIKEIIG